MSIGEKPRPATERDPELTRLRIIEAAIKLMAADGADSFSVLKAAQVAKVNRGTAYMHFGSRDRLIAAAIEHVSQQISAKLYSNIENDEPQGGFSPKRIAILEDMALFLIRNPELSRVWLFEVLTKQGKFADSLTLNVRNSIERFSRSRFGADDIDAEIYALIVFGSYFLWPLLIRSRRLSAAKQRKMAERLVTEILRMSLFGSVRPEHAPDLVEAVKTRIEEARKDAK